MLLLGSLVLLAVALAFAQDDPPGPPMQGPGAQRVEQWKKVRLMEILKLDDETAIRFFNRYNKHQEDLRDVQRQREETLRRLESLRRSNAADADIDKAIQDLRSVEGKILETRDRFWKELRTVLNTKQFADYVFFESTFNRQLRELTRDMMQERMQRRLR